MRLQETVKNDELLETQDANAIKGGGRDTRTTTSTSTYTGLLTTTPKKK